ncbi:MAG: ATP-binding protein [Spirochaetota bacterium]
MDGNLKEFDFGVNDIGIFLMESITTGLYKNPMNVLREYISNEIDNVPSPTLIDVKVEMRKVIISGNGPGMDYDGIRDAVKVGFSPKDLKKNIGFRGIGIYSGVAICNKIVLTTKRRENPKYYQIVINCKGLRDDIKKGSSISLIDSLKSNIKWSEITAPKEQAKYYGTAVELIDILEDFKEILDEEKVKKYLEMTIPINFERDFPFRKDIETYLKTHLGNDFKMVELRINNVPVYRAPKYVSLERPIFGKISVKKKLLGIYWICQNARTGKIDDEYSRGLVYRKKGFTVGDRTTITTLFMGEKDKHLIDYITGEVHITTDELLPNTERVEFEASPARDILEQALVQDIRKEISQMTRKKSAISRAEMRIIKAEDLPNKPEFESEEIWLNEITDAKKLLDGLKADLKNKHIPPTMKKKIERAHKRVDSWIKKNSKPPKQEIIEEETEIHEEEIGEEAEEKKEPEIERIEELGEALENEEKLPSEWFPIAVEEMCYRIGHSEWKDVIMKTIDVLKNEAFLKSDEEVRAFLQKLELRLAI